MQSFAGDSTGRFQGPLKWYTKQHVQPISVNPLKKRFVHAGAMQKQRYDVRFLGARVMVYCAGQITFEYRKVEHLTEV